MPALALEDCVPSPLDNMRRPQSGSGAGHVAAGRLTDPRDGCEIVFFRPVQPGVRHRAVRLAGSKSYNRSRDGSDHALVAGGADVQVA
jgi:hypothetical protein